MRSWIAVVGFACIVATAIFAASSFAQTRLAVDGGWGDALRLGRWNPLFITVSDPAARRAILEVSAPHDAAAAIRIQQRVSISASSTTFELLAPFQATPEQVVVTVRDEATGRTLAAKLLQDPHPAPGELVTRKTLLAGTGMVVGIAGELETAQTLAVQLRQANFAAGYLDDASLPDVPMGYDAIELLILSGPDLTRLRPAQQQAIVNWVRAGGGLILWPGTAALPGQSPLQEILPAALGDVRGIKLTADQAAAAGLSKQPLELPGRVIRGTNGTAFDVFPRAIGVAQGFRRRVGFGWAAVLSADVSVLKFDSAEAAQAFWGNILPAGELPSQPPAALTAAYGSATPRAAAAKKAYSDLNPPPALRDYSPWAVPLAVGFFIIGPVDWLVLRRLGRRGITWTTAAGGAGFLAALLVLAANREQPLAKGHGTRLVDQADGRVVGICDAAAMAGDRQEWPTEPTMWWEPGGAPASPIERAVVSDLNFRQDRVGNQPTGYEHAARPWLVRGMAIVSQPPLLEAHLSWVATPTGGMRLVGTLTTRDNGAWSDVRIVAKNVDWTLPHGFNPGATVAIDQLADPSADDKTAYLREMPDLAPERSAQVARWLKAGDAAVVYAGGDKSKEGDAIWCRAIFEIAPPGKDVK